MGSFSKDEFINGMTALSIDSLAKLKERLPELRDQALSNLDAIYMFAFHFLKDNSAQRLVALPGNRELLLLLPAAGALATIRILLAHMPHTESFVDYMSNYQTTYKAMNMDQWSMFLAFNKAINIDFDEYDMDGAWPLVLDDFVTFMRQKKKVKAKLQLANRVRNGMKI